MASTNATATANPNPPGLVSGKLIVLASIAVFVLIGVGFWAAGKWFSAHPIEADDTLDYANRAEWVVMPATTILLTEPPRYMRGPYGSKIKKELPFAVTPAVEEQLNAWSVNARQGKPAHIDDLPLVRPSPTATDWYFYWLLAKGSLLDGQNTQDFDAYLSEAYESAPAVLTLTYRGLDDRPFANQPIGDIELTFARKANDVLDDSLRLAYPDNSTDEFGRVYLPVFDTPLQVSVKPDPPGHEAEYPFSGWLIFPGKVGGPEPIVVRPTATSGAD
ncbi:MAG: hypothetical protein AAFY08_00505 [Planctomycetota bacterium]